MSADTDSRGIDADSDRVGEILHVVCDEHDPDTTFCGEKGTERALDESGLIGCVVCEDLEDFYENNGGCCPDYRHEPEGA